MGLTSIDIVRVYRFCPIQDIQRYLKEEGYLVKLSIIADMLQIVFLEIELEEDKASKGVCNEADKPILDDKPKTGLSHMQRLDGSIPRIDKKPCLDYRKGFLPA